YFLSYQYDGSGRPDDEHAWQQPTLFARHGAPRVHRRPPLPADDDQQVSHLPFVRHALLDRRMGLVLGIFTIRYGLPAVAGRSPGHAVLADAPLRPGHLFTQLSPRQMDTTGMCRFPGG